MRSALAVALAVSSSLVPVAALAQVASDDTIADTAAAPSGGLDDIVVTARRRSENLQDVPLAVTAFSSEALEQ